MFKVHISTDSSFVEDDNQSLALVLFDIAHQLQDGSVTMLKKSDWFERY